MWRAHGHPKRLYDGYMRLFGPAKANLMAKRLPPRPLVGRWGTKDSTESFLKQTCRAELPVVIKEWGGVRIVTRGWKFRICSFRPAPGHVAGFRLAYMATAMCRLFVRALCVLSQTLSSALGIRAM
eukprot:13918970-Alexandrium_andersonii.AAC.1